MELAMPPHPPDISSGAASAPPPVPPPIRHTTVARGTLPPQSRRWFRSRARCGIRSRGCWPRRTRRYRGKYDLQQRRQQRSNNERRQRLQSKAATTSSQR